jgi:hypothetical protein
MGNKKRGSGKHRSVNQKNPPVSMPGTGTSAMFLVNLQKLKPMGICNIGRKLFHKFISALK